MAAPRRRSAPPIYVLRGTIDMDHLTGDLGEGWTQIECASKKAYGCGDHGQDAVQGLTLYARLGGGDDDGAHVTSSLAVRMSDDALRTFITVSDKRHSAGDVSGSEMYALGRILMAEQGLIVLVLSLYRACCGGSDRDGLVYCLVYDDVDASLSMTRYLPDGHECASTLKPVPRRAAGGGACDLLFMASKMPPGLLAPRDNLPAVLCVFSPDQAKDDPASCPWRIKGRRFPAEKIREPFIADSVFSFQGRGYWADLSQGIVHCDLHTAATGAAVSAAVDFGFVELPPGCKLDLAQTVVMWDDPKNFTRTMAGVGDSIRFASIDRTAQYANDVLTMWTLQLPHMQWKEEWKFSARELWGFDGFKEAGLPEAPLEFPILTSDGALFVVLTERCHCGLPGTKTLVPPVGHICSIDVLNKRILWHGLVHDYPFIKPVILPSNFFQRKHGPSGKEEVEEQRPSADGLASLVGYNTVDCFISCL
ncbi:unnamed protein product [Urochloa humidicola]